jgi:DNA-directed RNA polymerase subunit RPC12/RpoP
MPDVKKPVCGIAGTKIGCGVEVHYERYGGDWPESTTAIRCLDCGTLFCVFCARKHFAETDEKDREIQRLEIHVKELLD